MKTRNEFKDSLNYIARLYPQIKRKNRRVSEQKSSSRDYFVLNILKLFGKSNVQLVEQ